MRVNLQSLNTRKDALLGESSKIEQKYQSMGIAVQKEHLSRVQQFNMDMDKIREQFEPLFGKNRTEHLEADRLLQDTAEAGLNAIRSEHHHAIRQEAHWSGVVANPLADPVAVEALEKKRTEMEVLREKMRATQGGRPALETQKTQSGREYAEQGVDSQWVAPTR